MKYKLLFLEDTRKQNVLRQKQRILQRMLR